MCLLAASVPGLLLLGYLTDHWPLRMVITLSCLGSAAACLLLWGFSTNTSVLIAFVVIFGLLGPSFSAVWAKLIGIIASKSIRSTHDVAKSHETRFTLLKRTIPTCHQLYFRCSPSCEGSETLLQVRYAFPSELIPFLNARLSIFNRSSV